MYRLQRFIAAGIHFLAPTRMTWLLLVTLACLLVREQYPFSNFPMYSGFGRNTYYVYLADGNGTPIPALTTMGVSTPTLKKMFADEMAKEREHFKLHPKKLTLEQKRDPGERLLARIKSSSAALARSAPKPEVLRLYEVTISLEGERFTKQTVLIAEK